MTLICISVIPTIDVRYLRFFDIFYWLLSEICQHHNLQLALVKQGDGEQLVKGSTVGESEAVVE